MGQPRIAGEINRRTLRWERNDAFGYARLGRSSLDFLFSGWCSDHWSAGGWRRAEQFSLAGRSMPWWLLGFSLVATTFAADTPLFVAGLVRESGVAANSDECLLSLSGMFTVFVFAKLWRRSGVVTDLEFYELRVQRSARRFSQGVCSRLYLGVLLNIIIMAIVTLSAIKISSVMLGLGAMTTVIVACAITAVFSMLGGLTSVLWVDACMFVVAMVGSIERPLFR